MAKVVIIGAGIAGLCAGVYARRSGYDVEMIERHGMAGGLATSWRRGDYTFETCLHWLLGSREGAPLHAEWREVFDIDALTFVDQEEYGRIAGPQGEELILYTDADRMEAELLKQAPQDAKQIHHLAAAVRKLRTLEIPDPGAHWPQRWLAFLRTIPELPVLYEFSRISMREYSQRFSHPLLSAFLSGGETGNLSALAFVFSLAWMSRKNAGYAVGGSQAIIRAITEKFKNLGGRLRFGVGVKKILVENGAAAGVVLEDGEIVNADWVISAADGHATIYDMLEGSFRNAEIDKAYETLEPFPSYVQVSLGVSRNLSHQPVYLVQLLEKPLLVDPQTSLSQIAFRVFNFDTTFAPQGKTAVTAFLPTRNYGWWADLHAREPARYESEKQRIANGVIAVLEVREPGISPLVEVRDVSTPATVIRYTGNWKGSMEGWILAPGMGFSLLHNTLPGLKRFRMAGQWVMPGGGLPSGLMSARLAIQSICEEDSVPFLPGSHAKAM